MPGVFQECYGVSKWRVLGVALGITLTDLDRIRENESNADDRQLAMFARWFNTGQASWRNLVKGLLYPPLKAQDIAKDVASNHPKL